MEELEPLLDPEFAVVGSGSDGGDSGAESGGEEVAVGKKRGRDGEGGAAKGGGGGGEGEKGAKKRKKEGKVKKKGGGKGGKGGKVVWWKGVGLPWEEKMLGEKEEVQAAWLWHRMTVVRKFSAEESGALEKKVLQLERVPSYAREAVQKGSVGVEGMGGVEVTSGVGKGDVVRLGEKGVGVGLRGLMGAVERVLGKDVFERVFAKQQVKGGKGGSGLPPGSPVVLVLSTSGVRCMDVYREIRNSKRGAAPFKLFAKHMSAEEQEKRLKSHKAPAAVGTPVRIQQLIDAKALKTTHLRLVVVDLFGGVKNLHVLHPAHKGTVEAACDLLLHLLRLPKGQRPKKGVKIAFMSPDDEAK